MNTDNSKRTDYSLATLCLHGNSSPITCDSSGAISFPIYQSATFAHPDVGHSTGYDYSRLQNPTREHLEKIVCSLEHGFDTLAFSSGMAAISTVMELFEPGDHLICSNDLYGGSIRLFNSISKKNQLSFDYVNTSCTDITSYLRSNTKAIYIETPSNPMMNVTDIKKISILAHEHNLLVIIDNTFLSPYFQNPIDLGADIVVHSGTKYLGGHNDTIAGFVVVNTQELSDKLRFLIKTVGNGLAPFDSWLILRGVKTLALRMEQGQKSAIQIAEWLSTQAKVMKVHYPGLKSHPQYSLNSTQARGFGCMLTFAVDSKNTALHVLSSLNLIQYAESLGGVETLITYPYTQTHADVPVADRERNGISDCILRLSVGIEDVNDLISDLSKALL
jgi:cystathionine gamma-synthase